MKNFTEFPELYCLDKLKKKRLWKIWVEEDVIYKMSGLEDGKLITHTRQHTSKNIGKINETTPFEQAVRVAQREWVKQIDKNYKPDSKDLNGVVMYQNVLKEKRENGGHNINATVKMKGSQPKKSVSIQSPFIKEEIETVIPMKATVWDVSTPHNLINVKPNVLKHFNLNDGFYLQPKYDGWRCLVNYTSSGVILTTNTKKQYPWFENLRKQLQLFYNVNPKLKEYMAIDGELYTHHMTDNSREIDDSTRFSMIQSICAITNKSPHHLENQINYYIFDLVHPLYLQSKRVIDMKELKIPKECPNIKISETVFVNSLSEISTYYNSVIQQGYEGIIVRAYDLKYVPNHRSLKMRKIKTMQDSEYLITGVEVSPGVSKENFVWVCETEDGKKFKAKPMGCKEDKLKWYANRENYIKKYLTVKFQEYTDDGIPRFPIAKEIRLNGDW